MRATIGGTTLVAEAAGNEVRIVDTAAAKAGATPTLRATLKGHSNLVTGLVLSADGKTLATCGYDKTTRLWDMESGECRATLRRTNAADFL